MPVVGSRRDAIAGLHAVVAEASVIGAVDFDDVTTHVPLGHLRNMACEGLDRAGVIQSSTSHQSLSAERATDLELAVASRAPPRLHRRMHDDLEFSADPSRLDLDRVHTWLAEESYWAIGRSRAALEAAVAASSNYGIYAGAGGAQLAYARVITDGVTFAWLCDVFVDTEARGHGIGVALIEQIMATLEPLGLRRIGLTTADAHGLYERFGFTALEKPEQWMVRMGPVDAR